MEGHLRTIIRQKIVDAQAAPVPAFTRRDVHLPMVPGKAKAVVGMRRSGKTTLLWQVIADRVASGMPREGLLYFNFEDERLADLTASDLALIVEEFYRLHPQWRDAGTAVFLLDEIQVISGWERFARRLLDTERVEIFLSGSSARMLSREVATSIRGRALEVRVFPFSFREFLRHHGREPEAPPGRLTKAARSTLEKDVREYLAGGGFPETQGLEARDRLELLRGYVDVVLLRDMIERHGVSQPVALRWLVRQLLGNAAGAFSVHKFYRDVKSQGFTIAKDTLHAYLGYIEDAFLVTTVFIATDSERRRMANPRKVYPVDPGLIALFDRSGKANLGHALETSVLSELLRRGAEVAYVRTPDGLQVDFLARYPEGGQELIQVCAELDEAATREREARAMIAAAAAYPKARLSLITLTPETALGLPKDIAVHSAANWLLTVPP